MQRNIKFTKRTLENIELPSKGKRIAFHDTVQLGLSLRVTHNGSKSFIVRYRQDGKLEYFTLGHFPKLTIENARKSAQTVLAKVARGDNPARSRKEKRMEDTLSSSVTRYMEDVIKPKRSPRTIDGYENIYQKHIHPRFGSRKLSDISYSEIEQFHSKLGRENGKYIANRVIVFIKALYTWLKKKRLYSGDNPAYGIEQFKEEARDRFLQPDELECFFDALSKEENQDIKDYILLSLLTGARKSNMLAMRWEEIDFKKASWRIPKTKNQEPVVIPLVQPAIDILKTREQTTDWVFPSHGKSGHLVEPKRGWKRILERAGITDLRIHDLRRTLGSWLASDQAPLTIIAKALGQKSTQATGVYSRLHLDPIRASMEKATSAMLEHKNE